jgi:tRNA nucleotidyltransferase (CCA-adding enzyme)
MSKMTIKLPQNVKRIIEKLNANGYEGYAVGGCVRDAILGRNPEDWDITTSATPQEVKQLFKRTFDTGSAHGTVSVLIGSGEERDIFEVTTYRIDGEYKDSRHPAEVEFTRSLAEDLKRRDFTMNALAYNDEKGLVDIFGGQEDIENEIIRAVGVANERFEEDALRILRGIRFSAQLGFKIEECTQLGMKALASNLANISAERIQVELIKLLVSSHPEKIREAYELGITKVILPEFDVMMQTEQETPHHKANVGEHTILALENIRADKVLRLTMLFHDFGKPLYKTIDENGVAHFKKHALASFELSKSILRRLKFDNDTIDKVSHLVYYHDYRMPATKTSVRRAVNKIGIDLFPLYLEVRKADVLSQSEYQREEKLKDIETIKRIFEEIVADNECVQMKDLAINGKDLIALGVTQGKEIGKILKELLEVVLDNPEENEREKLLNRVRQFFI